ncbi:GPW/gp25 family protein [Streptomyces sp. H27-D2]|uniref:GPW/gp25 family protein n=1 Tax=Streptomyces sp. H27-D2 TaxID=3046304 RepID=UPI002DBCE7E8|nr:GPW/gp25 family protein [Streptomyces sp. H27-D2]MEC4018808.1 GPW/gp25 family protein [Streptomyces sp. H27-D2]
MATGFGFPFGVNQAGAIAPAPDENAELRGKVIQVLFTAPGERINQPEFGCGLFNLVFDPNNTIMAAAVEFTVGQALTRWLGDVLVVGAVDVQAQDEALTVEVAYVRRQDLTRQAVRVHFR